MPATEKIRRSHCIVGCAALWLLVGCTSADNTAYAAADPLAAVRALIGDAACSTDAHCATIAVGAKACGGPEAYLAWSTERSDGRQLEAAAATYNASRLETVVRGGRVSNCALTIDPGAWCAPVAAGRACQLQRTGSSPLR